MRLPKGIWAVFRYTATEIPKPFHRGRQLPSSKLEIAAGPNFGETFTLYTPPRLKYEKSLSVQVDIEMASIINYK